MNVPIRHLTRGFPEHPSLHDELSGVSFHKANWFPNILFEYIRQEYESFLNPSNPVHGFKVGLVTKSAHIFYTIPTHTVAICGED